MFHEDEGNIDRLHETIEMLKLEVQRLNAVLGDAMIELCNSNGIGTMAYESYEECLKRVKESQVAAFVRFYTLEERSSSSDFFVRSVDVVGSAVGDVDLECSITETLNVLGYRVKARFEGNGFDRGMRVYSS